MHTKTKPTIGVALVGLGSYSGEQLAPALTQTRLCQLRGIVTGNQEKARAWKAKYGLSDQNIYSYENFDSIKSNPDIDVVYIVLPNAMHAEFTIRAAKAGKHVICEKPMAVTVEDCQRMIQACRSNDRLLSIGYRLHFEPYNVSLAAIAASGSYGAIKKVITRHSLDIQPNVWRLNKALAGGGPLMDVGIYCVQAAMYVTGREPIAVTALEAKKTDLKRFAQVEQSISWSMEFSNGIIAHCESAYDKEEDLLRVEMSDDWIQLQPAFAYNGLKAQAGNSKVGLLEINQQARQMDDFAQCVLEGKPSKVGGEMGARDVKILLAIYESAQTGKRIVLQ